MTYKPKDYFFKKAKEENYAARSVFKLEEIDKKFKLFASGQRVLDLGAAPGSWSQYASKKIGPQGRILGLDLTAISLKLPNAVFIQADIRESDMENLAREHQIELPFDVVLSDMAPKTTGIRITDQARSYELCEMALQQAQRWLRPGGHFVCKLFHSDDFTTLKKQILENFEKFDAVKPESTRKISKEIFLVGLKKKRS